MLHPGFSLSSDPGHSRPTLSRQRSRITKVYVHFVLFNNSVWLKWKKYPVIEISEIWYNLYVYSNSNVRPLLMFLLRLHYHPLPSPRAVSEPCLYYYPSTFCSQDLAGMIFDHVMQDLLQDEWWKHFRYRNSR